MKYTQIPSTTFQNIQMNAGILVDAFNPATGEIGNILGATSGGVNFTDTPSYVDFGEDIDNCPKNTKELKRIESREVAMSGTMVTISPDTAAMIAGAADKSGTGVVHIVPRDDLLTTDFKDIWWIGDYSDTNTGANAGFVAIHLLNALSTAGFQIQSGDKAKGQFAFTFTGHYSIAEQDVVPYEIYIKNGASTEPSIILSNHTVTVTVGDTVTLTAITNPSTATVTWNSANSSVASVSGGVVTAGSSAGNTIITASITEGGVTYSDTCTVIVAAAQA